VAKRSAENQSGHDSYLISDIHINTDAQPHPHSSIFWPARVKNPPPAYLPDTLNIYQPGPPADRLSIFNLDAVKAHIMHVQHKPGPKSKKCFKCQIKLRSLQSIRLSSSTDYSCAFGPARKVSKVEKPSSRGVSSLHRWFLMLLPVLWLMPLCALCTHVCVSTTLCLLSFGSPPHCCSFPELGPMTQIDISASLLLHINIAKQTNK